MRKKAQVPIPPIRSPEEALRWFEDNGITVTAWCKENGLKRHTVVDLLHGRLKGKYGEAHKAAIALGIKPNPQTKRVA